MRDFRSLDVWHEARTLAKLVYRLTRDMPAEELFGMTSQMRRAAVSVSTNIAEGCGRDTQGDLIRFLEIAMGSATEVESLLIIAVDLEFLTEASCAPVSEQAVRVRKMLAALLSRFPRRYAPRPTARRSEPAADNLGPLSLPADQRLSHDVD